LRASWLRGRRLRWRLGLRWCCLRARLSAAPKPRRTRRKTKSAAKPRPNLAPCRGPRRAVCARWGGSLPCSRPASPQSGPHTLAPVARLGTTERSRTSARISGRKNHCRKSANLTRLVSGHEFTHAENHALFKKSLLSG
jgi:hypothetical protein